MSIVKKKFSRKNKSSWRKFVNIKDVEDYLEEKRQEERIGSVSDKKDDDLFIIDTPTDSHILTTKQKRKLKALKPPRNLSILENSSKVQVPVNGRGSVKLKKSGRNRLEELLNPIKSGRVLQSLGDRNKYYKKLDKKVSKKKGEKVFHDVWEEEEEPDRKQFLNNQWIPREMGLHNLKSIGKPLVKVHASAHHKRSHLKAFERPHPGISYNPSLKDHQDLMQKVIDKETDIIKEEEHLKRVTTDMFRKITAEQRDANLHAELCSGIAEEENGDCEELSLVAADVSVNPPAENKKKDKKARRKQKEEREKMRELQLKKEKKKQVTDIHRLKHIHAEVLMELSQTDEAKKRRKLCKEKKKYEPRRIGKIKYTEPEIDVNMVEDIPGNLRNVKTGNSLLVDRFKDFQKRNILAPSVDVGTRKRTKIKRFVRSSHKDAEVKI